MPRTKEQFEEMRNATKEKIQAAAMELFARKGLAATNVQEIADTADISIGLLYRHYKTKEELFYELVDFAHKGLMELNLRLQSDASPRELIKQIIKEVYNDLAVNNDFINLMILLTQAVLQREEGSKLSGLLDQDYIMIQALAGLIRLGQEAGEFRRGDPYEMSVFFFSAVQGLAISKKAFGAAFRMPAESMLTQIFYDERKELI